MFFNVYRYFRPTLVYQEMLSTHVADKSLEFKVDFESGKNYARFGGGLSAEQLDSFENPDIRDDILAKQLKFVPQEQSRDDGPNIANKLRTAAAHGDIEAMKHLIRTTYCTVTTGNLVLAETMKEGNMAVLQLLLECGANPGYRIPTLDNRTSLHFAASIGREDMMKELISSMHCKQDAYAVVDGDGCYGGYTAFQILKEVLDHGKAAARLQRLADELPESVKRSNTTDSDVSKSTARSHDKP